MPETDVYLNRIHDKLQLLLKEFMVLQKENAKLRQEMTELKKKAKEKDEQIDLLALRLEVLKAAKSEMTEDEKKLFEKKISQYIKEIDLCIAFLNE